MYQKTYIWSVVFVLFQFIGVQFDLFIHCFTQIADPKRFYIALNWDVNTVYVFFPSRSNDVKNGKKHMIRFLTISTVIRL